MCVLKTHTSFFSKHPFAKSPLNQRVIPQLQIQVHVLSRPKNIKKLLAESQTARAHGVMRDGSINLKPLVIPTFLGWLKRDPR